MNETVAYASGTKVSVEKSRLDLEGILAKYGASNRAVVVDDARAVTSVLFIIAGRKYRLDVPLPRVEDFRPPKLQEPYGWREWSPVRKDEWVAKHYDQACRERWRFLVLAIKAKLELARIGLSSIEREFLADLVLPNGKTAGEELGEYMSRLLADGYKGPLMLPEGP